MFSQNNLLKLNECLACGSDRLVLTLDLNNQPLANSYKNSKKEYQEEFPLAINRCQDCFHVQLTHAVNPELMFKDYLYVSGTSKTMKNYFKWFADYAHEYFETLSALRPVNVLDIGCNDGSQLDAFAHHRVKTFGIDPAQNLYKVSSQRHTVWPEFFNMDFVLKTGKIFDILIAQNVFAHNFDPKAFLRAARIAMSDDSLLFVQTSQADMILNNEFDTIYHEHINFFNIKSMNELCTRVGLFLVDVIKTPLHGNSYLFVISRNRLMSRPANIANAIEIERKAGLYTDSTYVEYAKKCTEIVTALKTTLDQFRGSSLPIVGYGAAAKGMTLLNYGNIELDYIIDDNPLKQNKFTPGMNIPIFGSEKLLDERPTVFVPLAWNFYDEIKAKIKAARPNIRDQFVTYFPKVEVHTT